MTLDRISAMPTASVGAPPVRDRIVAFADVRAASVSMSGVTVKPQPEIAAAAVSGVVPRTQPGCSSRSRGRAQASVAAISAMIATKLSISIAP